MAKKPCRKCKGTGWIGPRSEVFGRGGHECGACRGTRFDLHWGETNCKHCSATIDYRYDWNNIPEYCSKCRQWRTKRCANPYCRGTVRYKVYWTNVQDFCSECKGWREKPCPNPHCRGKIRIHVKWYNPPKYCTSCKGWYEKTCTTPGCGGTIRIHCDWTHPPNRCQACKAKASRRSIEEICHGTELEEFLAGRRGANIKDMGSHWHVSIYVDGGHISANIDKYTGRTWDKHVRIRAYKPDGSQAPRKDDLTFDL